MTRSGRSPRGVRDERGCTLIEALAAIAILGIAVAGTLNNLTSMTHLNGRSEIRSQAMVAGRDEMERLRAIDPAGMPTYGNEERAIEVDQRTFRVVTNYCVDAGVCDDITRHIYVEVFDDDERVFDAETVFGRLD